jgi:general transcriptional corepressor TUP1
MYSSRYPSGSAAPPAGKPAPAAISGRMGDLLDQVKAEYETVAQQLSIATMAQATAERKLQAQLVEMNQLQQTLTTLEANHRRIRQQYEEDLMRMRRQLEGRQPDAAAGAKRHRSLSNNANSNGPVHVPVVAVPPRPSSATSPPSQLEQGRQGESGAVASLRHRSLGPGPSDTLPSVAAVAPPLRPQSSTSSPHSPHEGQSTTPPNRRADPLPSLRMSRYSETTTKSEPPSSSPAGPSKKKAKTSSEDSKGAGRTASSPSSTASSPSQQVADTKSTKQPNAQERGSSTSAPKSSTAKGRKPLQWNWTYGKSPSFANGETKDPEVHQTMEHKSVVCCVRFSPDGTMLATGCSETARVFDVQSGKMTFNASRPGDMGDTTSNDDDDDDTSNKPDGAFVRAVAFSPDSSKLVAGMPQNTVRVWDLATQKEGPVMMGHDSEVYALDCVGDLVVSGSGDRTVRLWDARTGACKKILGRDDGGPSDGVTSVALSRDGKYLAAGSLDKVVRIWDTETTQLLDRLEGHSDSVYAIAFSPDSKNLISGSFDRNVFLWDVNGQSRTSSRPRMVFQGHKDLVLSVAYTPDGR